MIVKNIGGKRMKKEMSNGLMITLTVIAILFFFVLVSVSWVWGTYNTFIVATQDLDNQWSNIKTEYQRRADLFYNLVEITKSYASFEQETMQKVVQARSGAFTGTKDKQISQMNELDSVFSRLLLVMEQYPNLKSIEQYNKLSEEVQRTENRIQIARTDYNALVRNYNILITKFPRNILAGTFSYTTERFFESESTAEKAPKLDMQ